MVEIKNFPNNRDEFRGAYDVMRWLHGRTSGVFGAAGNAAVSALPDAAMAVLVSDGDGWLADVKKNGCVWWIDTEETTGSMLQLEIAQADGVLDRIDRIIVEWETTSFATHPLVKVLQGVASSAAVAPALANDATVRQISLARISVRAGTTAITPSMITDERLDRSVCGIVSDCCEMDTSVMQAQFNALLKSIQQELADLEAGTAVELKKLLFENTNVPTSAFTETNTYEDYPYSAAIALSGVTAGMIPEVIFFPSETEMFAPVAACYNGGVSIYAADIPEATITIPTIVCWRGA